MMILTCAGSSRNFSGQKENFWRAEKIFGRYSVYSAYSAYSYVLAV